MSAFSRRARRSRFVLCLLMTVALTLGACTQTKHLLVSDVEHRYFLEVDRPGLVFAALTHPDVPGAFVRLLEIDVHRQPLGDTLTAWVQHFDGRKAMSREARRADLVVACHRQRQPSFAQRRHVLPGSMGNIYVYMMRGGILILTDERIPFYDVLMVPSGSVYGPIAGHADGPS